MDPIPIFEHIPAMHTPRTRHFGTLDEAFLWATECNMATLVSLCMKKAAPKSEIERQKTICLSMLMVCKNPSLVTTPKADEGSRTQEVLDAARNEPEGVEGALDRYTKRFRDQWRDGK